MENFSTPRAALLPRAANLATLAVVVAATWWSSAQRPLERPELAAQATAPSAAGTATEAAKRQPADLAAAGTRWPVQTSSLTRDGLQAVGYQPRATR